MTINKICIVMNRNSLSVPKLLRRFEKLQVPAITSPYPQDGYFNIGWGRGAGEGGLNKNCPKDKMIEMLAMHNAGVSVVPMDLTFEDAVKRAKDTGNTVILGRKKRHSCGRDILKVDISKQKRKPTRYRDFWTQYIEKVKEYRVHVFCGKVSKIATKIKREETRNDKQHEFIWNLNSHVLDYKQEVVNFDGLIIVAKQAIKAYGMDFGAVDIIEDNTGKFWVLEINLKPGIDGAVCTYYAKKMVEQMNKFNHAIR